MTSKALTKVLPKAITNRKKQRVELPAEEMNFLIWNTSLGREKLEDQYKNFLSNHAKGKMSKKSFNSMMKESYPGVDTKKLCRHVFRMYDTNGDGSVDFKKFVLALDVFNNGSAEQNLKQIFRVLDINNDGKIHVMELLEVVRDIFEMAKRNNSSTTENWDTLAGGAFAEMDLNEDGEITEEEFITACLKQKKFSTIVILHIIDFLSA
eukprot:TRINITY_DN12363_c0_g1_i1.p1 TRINITY_DN12363_c0_g1~~TRINITY_DN12363_c0_g1_i1.p1  ORF type:complete len:208 (-),score=53.86 TRINITY_DN12363_c0_g1_i1:237-860(-)